MALPGHSHVLVVNRKDNASCLGFGDSLEWKFVLLHGFWKCTQAMQYSKMIAHLLTAASLLVAISCKQSTLPPVQKWCKKTHNMYLMCNLTAINKFKCTCNC